MNLSKQSVETIVQSVRNFGVDGITVPDAYYIGYKLLSHFTIYNPSRLDFDKEDRLVTGANVYLNCIKKQSPHGEEFFFIIRTHKEELVMYTRCVFEIN